MREQREMTDFIRRQRQADTEKQLQDLKSLCKVGLDDQSGTGIDWGKVPTRNLGVGSMRDRCAALQEHLENNAAILRNHRLTLDEVHALRRERRAHAGLSPEEPAASEEAVAATLEAAPPPAPGTAWAAPELAADEPPSRARSSGAAAGARNARTRPGSAGLGATVRPVTPREGQPSSGVWSWAGSRPPSAGSLRARCGALEQNVKRNSRALESNRLELSVIIKLREEGRRKLLESLQDALPPQSDETALPA